MSAARTTETAVGALADLGYEPSPESRTCVRLTNCPFDAAVADATDVVCGLNLRFVSGILDGLGGHRSVRAALDPGADRCCVAIRTD
jgi:predicted ArsR family transcriptional regulator